MTELPSRDALRKESSCDSAAVAAASPDASAEKSRADTRGDTTKREEEGSLDAVTPRRRVAAASLDISPAARRRKSGRNQEWRRSASGPGSTRTGRRWVTSLTCAIIWASYLLGLISKWALRIIKANGLYELEGVVSRMTAYSLRVAFPTNSRTRREKNQFHLSPSLVWELGGRRERGGRLTAPDRRSARYDAAPG